MNKISCLYYHFLLTCFWRKNDNFPRFPCTIMLTDIIYLLLLNFRRIDSKFTEWIKIYHSRSKENYRPVSILPWLSKVYEKVLAIQLGEYFENIFDQALSAFRAGYSCQDTLLNLVEKWKMLLREHRYAVAILMDLSTAFDCMSHGLLLAKLEAYGLSGNSIKVMRSYMTGRKQRVKIGNGEWADILKGVPQADILKGVSWGLFYLTFSLMICSNLSKKQSL